MNVVEIIALVGCLVGAGLGIGGMLNPEWVSKLVRLSPTDGSKEGRSELRAAFGGLYAFGHGGAAIALAAGFPGAGTGAMVLALGWFGSAVGRTYSILKDKTGTPLNAFNVGFELVLALILCAPVLWELSL